MKRLLVAARVEPKVWADMFRIELPDHEILVAPPPAGEPVAYAVVGKPESGLLASLTGIEVVLSLNAGVEHLLASGEVPAGTPIVRMVDDGLVEGMVDWVTAQVLAWHRNLFAYHASQAERRWAPRPEKLARERSVTVLGAGALGGPVATRLALLGFETRSWSRSPRSIAGVKSFAGADAFADAVDGVDVLVNLLPLTAETRDLLGRDCVRAPRPRRLSDQCGTRRPRGRRGPDRRARSGPVGRRGAGRVSGRTATARPPVLDPSRDPGFAPRRRPDPCAHRGSRQWRRSVRRHERGEPLWNVVDRERGY